MLVSVDGELAYMVERSLSMREVPGSNLPGTAIYQLNTISARIADLFFLLTTTFQTLFVINFVTVAQNNLTACTSHRREIHHNKQTEVLLALQIVE